MLWIGVALAALGFAALLVSALLTRATLRGLRDVPAVMAGPFPRLAVIVAARDEERGIEAAMRSLLAQDYEALEVVAVNDRSADATGAILDRLAAEDARLRPVHVRELPPGWLGKCHAQHAGASAADARWLLFTDGDILFDPGVLKRAVAYAEAHQLDHVVAFPHLLAPGFVERAFVSSFGLLLLPKLRTWTLRRAGGGGYVGVGAFNLVRAEAWRAIGGHERLKMEVVDDVRLGYLLRRLGYRQAALDSGGLVRVRWNEGFRESWRGLLKNAFAGAEWSWPQALAGAFALACLGLAPLLAAAFGSTETLRTAGLATYLAGAAIQSAAAWRISHGRGLEGLLGPIALVALAGAVIASAALAQWRGGIEWRRTRYPLRALRAGCVRERSLPASGAVGW
ncbi:MAG: glycosyltransferase family 2 protein [Vicinamibacteria bacterium]|nr:glycosyltransferase family 2 protein [Vicinamibacteria bacterium]